MSLSLLLVRSFHLLPCSGTYAVYFWRHALLATVLGELVQGVDRHEGDVVVLIYKLYHLLHLTVDVCAQQAANFSYAVVYMHYVVTRLYLAEFAQRLGPTCPKRARSLLSVYLWKRSEYLVVGEHA